ncbi:sulfur carrier protein ThiS [Fodinibius sediminis]|uniref:Sulfur carrier protein ThiS n=1 Tax=Fodinibius sediminis TaxID=1214077 RepID=A0A521AIR4_9BACT|nr:sulfur carrier protein ThiS [Fodinibius sediminis]SMO34648.1 sulfur carrier protein ThiS [Fodinibius sediminis]
MKLTINGEEVETDTETLSTLLQKFDMSGSEKGIAVAVNDTVITRDQWNSYQLNSDDHIEIIRATQGG